jgi:hypothetical protein
MWLMAKTVVWPRNSVQCAFGLELNIEPAPENAAKFFYSRRDFCGARFVPNRSAPPASAALKSFKPHPFVTRCELGQLALRTNADCAPQFPLARRRPVVTIRSRFIRHVRRVFLF